MPIKSQSQIISANYNNAPALSPQGFPAAADLENISAKIDSLRQKVFDRRPALRGIVKKLGPMSMFQISESYTKTPTNTVKLERKNEFIQVFSSEVSKILGQGVAQSVTRQLSEHYYVSTAEHHSPLTTPGFFNSSVHSALYTSYAKNSKLENVIVLACANISFDNYASPRGLVFNSFSEGKAVLNQIPLFSRSARPCPVVHYPSYTNQAIQDAKTRIDNLLRDGTIKPGEAEKLYFILDRIYARNDVLSLPYFSDQITKTNYILWNKLFFFLDKYAPNLIYLEQERIVNRLLVDHHLYKPTIINNFLFNPQFHKLIEKHFDGIGGAFSLKDRSGTFLFWAIPPGQRYRVQLWKEGNKLVSEDKSYQLELTPNAVAQAIANNELIPSTMLDYVLLAFYYGLRLHGGINQPTTLTRVKMAYLNMMKEIYNSENIDDNSMNIATTSLTMTRPALAFIKSPDNSLTPASSLDILLYGNDKSWKVMLQNAKNITYNEVFTRTLPNMYQFVYDREERDEKLLTLSENEIDKFIGLDKKIIPFAEI